MSLILIFAMVLSLSICIGINPYLSLLTLMIVAKSSIDASIPTSLNFITHDMFMVMVGVLAIIHFFVDLTAGLDTAWDMFHTVIRIPLAALFSVALLSPFGENWQLLAFCIGMIVGTISHFGKSSFRAYLNGKTHLAYNWFASMTETMIVVLLLALSVNFPLWSFTPSILMIALCVVFIKRYWRDFHHLSLHIIGWLRQRKGWREEDNFFN